MWAVADKSPMRQSSTDRPTVAARRPLFAAVSAGLWLGLFSACSATHSGLNAFERHDYSAARSTWLPLAEAGNAEAQFLLGTLYEEGRGVPPDFDEAAHWYERAATQGHPKALSLIHI